MPPRSRPAAVALVAAVLVLGPNAAPARAQASPDARAVEELRRAIEQRDAVIRDLLRRVEQLEGARGIEPGDAPSAPDLPAPAAGPAADDEEPASPAAEAAPPPAPGQFEVDEDAIDRALERTLVRTGALLLPVGKAEVEPSFTFTRRVTDVPVFLTVGGTQFLTEQERRRNEFDAELGLRVGLPFDSQLELALPYTLVDESRVIDAVDQETDDTGHGLGDLRVGLAKTVLREGAWWPDLIARVTWDSDLGEDSDDGVSLGGGTHELSGSLTAVRRQDPLVFVGSVSYQTAFEEDGVDPGDQLGVALGTLLAASPETSLRFFLDQSFVEETEVDGRTIDGSDQVAASLVIGASSVLGAGVFLDVTASVGLTDDAPDYAVAVSLPIRFDLPLPR